MRYFVLTLFLLTALIAGAQAPAIKNADSLFAIGNYAKAIKAYSDLKQPTSKSELNIARAYKAQGNSKKALDFYTNVVAKYPELVIAKYEYAKLLLSSKNISDAEKHFFELTHQYPTNPEFHFQLGRVLKRKATLTDSLKFKLLNTAKLAFAKAYTLDTTSLKAAYETSKILLL